MTFEKLLEQIYKEKDVSSNLAIVVGAASSFLVYVKFVDWYLATIAAMAAFALTKMLSNAILDHLLTKKAVREKVSNYSIAERNVIDTFILQGTCFITLSDLKSGRVKINEKGLDSLVARNIITFNDNSMVGDMPTGFQLSEDVYKIFLQ